jgi:hypothetical protein
VQPAPKQQQLAGGRYLLLDGLYQILICEYQELDKNSCI